MGIKTTKYKIEWKALERTNLDKGFLINMVAGLGTNKGEKKVKAVPYDILNNMMFLKVTTLRSSV